MTSRGMAFNETLAILAPDAVDVSDAIAMAKAEGVATAIVPSLGTLLSLLDRDPAAILLPEEALEGTNLSMVRDRLAVQPVWSDLPVIVIARRESATEHLDTLGNVIVVTRPFGQGDLARAVRTAFRMRRSQTGARRVLLDLEARESALALSEAKFDAVMETADHMIWSTSPEGSHDFFNARWYEFTGVPQGSTDGPGWEAVFHPDDRVRSDSRWQASIQSGAPYEVECRLKHHDGDYRWVVGRARPVYGPDGRIERWYGSCTDIHEQVMARTAAAAYDAQLEEDVRTRTAEFDDLFTKAPVMMLSLNADDRLVGVSDRWLGFMGCGSRDDVLGRPFADFVDMADPHGTFGSPADLGRFDDRVGTMRKASGDRADVLLSVRVIANEDPGLVRTIVAITDITDRKRAEVGRDRAEAALSQARKLETIGQLTGGIAHDFNNLLMAIRSSLELLERRLPDGDDRASKYIANAVRATERGASLTQRMLAFARRQDLATRSVDVNDLLGKMHDMLERSLGPGIVVRLSTETALDDASVDPNQLEMAILNLCVNARDALDGNGVVTIETGLVEIEAGAVLPGDRGRRGQPSDGLPSPMPAAEGRLNLAPGRYVRIAVMDAGIGMDAETALQAMEPFFTTKGVGKGTGLGLPMVYGLATQSGGTFRLSSVSGAGTTAEIFLPIHAGGQGEGVSDLPVPAREDRKERLTILAVDDDVLVLMGTVGLLEDLGHEVLEAYSGETALALLAQRPDIDLVITDHAMPKMTGVQLAEQIHRSRPEMPVILASGYAEMPEGGEKHITVRLEKPFGDRGLERVIEQVAIF